MTVIRDVLAIVDTPADTKAEEYAQMSRAVELRYWLSVNTAALAAELKDAGKKRCYKKRPGHDGDDDVEIQLPTTRLIPLCRATSRYVQLCKQGGRALLGMPLTTTSKEPPGDTSLVFRRVLSFGHPIPVPGRGALFELIKGNNKEAQELLAVRFPAVMSDDDARAIVAALFNDPLPPLFRTPVIQKLQTKRGFEFPASVRTDGVQLHIPFIERKKVSVNTRKGAVQASTARDKDAMITDPVVFAERLRSGGGAGFFSLTAVGVGVMEQYMANHAADPGGAPRVCAVDPGLINLTSTVSTAGLDLILDPEAVGLDPRKLTRLDYYGKRPKEVVYDPADAATTARWRRPVSRTATAITSARNPHGHSKRIR